ncbi:MAG: hypothetical protein PHV02_18075 [Rhodocyclaceae bacterium]|nr:hypothetical protein [Rhodocyclaceae bacterium]
MNNINQLRAALFETLQGVKEGTMEIDRAKAVSDVAQTIINTAKVEIDYIRATDADVATDFIGGVQKRIGGQVPEVPSLVSQLSSAGKK